MIGPSVGMWISASIVALLFVLYHLLLCPRGECALVPRRKRQPDPPKVAESKPYGNDIENARYFWKHGPFVKPLGNWANFEAPTYDSLLKLKEEMGWDDLRESHREDVFAALGIPKDLMLDLKPGPPPSLFSFGCLIDNWILRGHSSPAEPEPPKEITEQELDELINEGKIRIVQSAIVKHSFRGDFVELVPPIAMGKDGTWMSLDDALAQWGYKTSGPVDLDPPKG